MSLKSLAFGKIIAPAFEHVSSETHRVVSYYEYPFDSLEYEMSNGVVWDLPYLKEVTEQSAGWIIDAGCGWGRATISMLESGRQIVAIDRSHAMLDRLRETAKRRCYNLERLRVLEKDIQDVGSFAEVKGAVACYLADLSVNSFSSEIELCNAFEIMGRALQSNGTVILFCIGEIIDPAMDEYRGDVFKVGFDLNGKKQEVRTALFFDRTSRLLIQNCETYLRSGKSRCAYFASIQERFWLLSEIKSCLFQSGLEVIAEKRCRFDARALTNSDIWMVTARKV